MTKCDKTIFIISAFVFGIFTTLQASRASDLVDLGKLSQDFASYEATLLPTKDWPADLPVRAAYDLTSPQISHPRIILLEIDPPKSARGSKTVYRAFHANAVLAQVGEGIDIESARSQIAKWSAEKGLTATTRLLDTKLGIFSVHVAGNDVSPWSIMESLASVTGLNTVTPNEIALLDNNQFQTRFRFEQWHLSNRGQRYSVLPAVVDADIDGAELLSRIDATQAKLPNVTVAVIDSGIDAAHPALAKRLWRNTGEVPGNGVDDDGNGKTDDVAGWNFADDNADLSDRLGHGTHVSGIIASDAGVANAPAGLAPMARIMTLKVTNSKRVEDSRIIEALAYARDQGAKVVNMSFSALGFNVLIGQAIDAIYGKNVRLVASAGNDNQDVYDLPRRPCNYSKVYCVAASTREDKKRADSAYQGASNTYAAIVMIAAPGDDILSTLPGGRFGLMGGTSQAAPMVAAAYAYLMSARPTETVTQHNIRIQSSADRVEALKTVSADGRRLNIHDLLFSGSVFPERPQQYCMERVGGIRREDQYPFANSGEAGIDGASFKTAFTLCTARQLVAIGHRADYMDKHFILARDVDWNHLKAHEQIMIGDGMDVPFTGALSGGTNTHGGEPEMPLTKRTIFNFSIDRLASSALFRKIARGANPKRTPGAVINLAFKNASVRSKNGSAAVLAIEHGGMINFVDIDGQVEGRTNTGGIVALVRSGLISNSSFDGIIESPGGNAGGIAGEVREGGRLEHAHARGTIVSGRGSAGGLVGYLKGNLRGVGPLAYISQSHATAVVQSGNIAGGAVGRQDCFAYVSNSYTDGAVIADRVSGGLVGEIMNATIRQSYNLGFVEGTPVTHAGGLVGNSTDDMVSGIGDLTNWTYVCTGTKDNPRDSEATNSYYMQNLNPRGHFGEPKSRAELGFKQTYKNWHFGGRDWMIVSGFAAALSRLPRTTFAFPPLSPFQADGTLAGPK